MSVSVILIDWKRADLTSRAIRSVLAQRSDEPVELVVVVNEADPADVDHFRTLAPAAVVVPVAANSGFAGGVEHGVRAATGTVIALLNNDAVAEPGFVDRGVAALAAGGDRVAAIAATVLLEGGFVPVVGASSSDDLVAGDGSRWRRDPGGRPLLNGTGIVLDGSGNGRDRDWLRELDAPSEPTSAFGFSGGAAFIRRSALEAVGGFDPDLFMYYEDLDVSWRLRLAGYDVRVAPDVVVHHVHAASSGSDSSLVRYQSMRNRLAVVVRNGTTRFALAVALRTLGRCVRDLLRPSGAQLSRSAWLRLGREAPRLLRRARRLRRRDGFDASARRRVEATLAPTP